MGIRRELPEDVLTHILRRLPPRSLATSRCVCCAWREAIDTGRLLRADLLPLSVRGIFMNYCALHVPEFFSRPATGPAIWGDLDFIPRFVDAEVKDHCNGLLLIDSRTEGYYYVVNPATRRWARLPRFAPASSLGKGFDTSVHLVFDPMVSPHYEVFLIPILPDKYRPETTLSPDMLQSEWPPSSYPLQVFSSLTGRWEQRLFAREGGAAGTIADITKSSLWGRKATYW